MINNLNKGRAATILSCYSNVDAILKSEDKNDLEKGGEGSRGGKIIGHTKSGKPIYANSSVDKDFKLREEGDTSSRFFSSPDKNKNSGNGTPGNNGSYFFGDSNKNKGSGNGTGHSLTSKRENSFHEAADKGKVEEHNPKTYSDFDKHHKEMEEKHGKATFFQNASSTSKEEHERNLKQNGYKSSDKWDEPESTNVTYGKDHHVSYPGN